MPAENGSIYANYAVAQQPPGGASLELSSRENNANNPIFDPQKAKTAEIGTKWQLFGDGLLLTATLYDTRVSNEIVQDPIDQQYYRSEEHTSELQSLMRISYAVFCLKKKTNKTSSQPNI